VLFLNTILPSLSVFVAHPDNWLCLENSRSLKISFNGLENAHSPLIGLLGRENRGNEWCGLRKTVEYHGLVHANICYKNKRLNFAPQRTLAMSGYGNALAENPEGNAGVEASVRERVKALTARFSNYAQARSRGKGAGFAEIPANDTKESEGGTLEMSIKVFDWIGAHANSTPQKLAMKDLGSGRAFTYQQMHDRVGRLARHLKEAFGIKKGDRVAALCLNNPEILELQFACQRLGAICVLLNFRLALPELEYIVKDCGVSAFLTDTEFAETTQKLAELLGTPHVLITHADGSDSPYEQAIVSSEQITDYASLTLDDPATIMYTSGTTGRPKGAIITHSMALFNAVNCAVTAGVTATCAQRSASRTHNTRCIHQYTCLVSLFLPLVEI